MSVEFKRLPMYIANTELPKPQTEPEVRLKGEFGYFPHFDPNFLHGFHWRNPRNVSFMHEEEVFPVDAESRVLGAIGNVLESLQMSPIEQAVFANGTSGNTEIVDITKEVLDQLPVDPRKRFVEGGAYFTTLPDVPVYTKASDCTWTVLQATAHDGSPIGGLIHAGRTETDQMFPTKAIGHVIGVYGAEPESIKLGITPSLEPQHHTVRRSDFHDHISNPQGWLPYSRYEPAQEVFHLDVKSFVADQYIQRGVPPENIVLSLSGTFNGAANGNGFSQRRDTVLGQPSGRFGLAFQLT